MVYKNIGDKIPSFSSLLLAGVLLSGGSCSDSKNNSSDVNRPQSAPGDAVSALGQDAEGKNSQPLDKDSLELVKSIFKYLRNDVLMIDRLSCAPYTVSENDLLGEHAKKSIEGLCKSFSSLPYSQVYSPSLRDCFSNLSNLTFSTHGDLGGLKHKFAFGTALNEIAKVWNQFHAFYVDLVKLIDKGAPERDMSALLTKVDNFYNNEVRSKGIFNESHKFIDAKACRLLTGEQLGRFLTDKKGKKKYDKNKKYGMPALLKESINDVWIIGKASEDESRKAQMKNLAIRGSGIDGDWEVMGKSPMEEISPFPNSNKIKSKFTLGKGLEDLDEDSKASISAPVQENLTFGQFLFTLFRGNQKMDFFTFTYDHSNVDKGLMWFDIHSNDSVFQSVLHMARDMNNPDLFAQVLASHIENKMTGLQDLFVIPNVDEIEDVILGNFASDDTVANFGSQYVREREGKISDVHIKDNTVASKFLFHCAEVLGHNVNTKKEAFEVCSAYASDVDKIYRSSASITQKILVKILKSLLIEPYYTIATQEPVIASGAENSTQELLDTIKECISKEVSKAIAYKEKGVYKSTDVSARIQRWITHVGRNLGNKLNDAHVTYATIGQKAGGFNIVKVLNGMEEDYKAIQGLLTVKLGNFINNESLVLNLENYKAYFPTIDLMEAHISYINKIKSDYINKKKGKGFGLSN